MSGTLVVGIDPGNPAGLVAAEFPRWPDVGSGMIAHRVVHAKPERVIGRGYSMACRDRAFYALLRAFMRHVGPPAIAVIEEPLDAMAGWKSEQGGRREGRGTAFASGKHFGFALAACAQVGADRIETYPLRHQRGGRIGWMQARGNWTRKREHTLSHGRALLAAWGDRHLTTVSEHELMAAALIGFQANLDITAKIKAKAGV